MAKKTKERRPRRGFGSIKEQRSGRLQASYIGPDGRRHTAPSTFEARTDAAEWINDERWLITHDQWTPPKERYKARHSGLTLREFAPAAITRRRVRGRPLRPRTVKLYEGLLERTILPVLGDLPMQHVTADDIAEWYDALDVDQLTQRAHSYALVRSLFDQAMAEGRMPPTPNPCRIRGAGVTRRRRDIKPATTAELAKITEAAPERLRLMVLLTAWCGLRYGEVAMLRRQDIDVKAKVLHVRRAFTRVDGANLIGATKSDAGIRDVAIPPHLAPAIEDHLRDHTGRAKSSLLFPHHPGGSEPWQHGTFYKLWIDWRKAAGREDLRFHDLRHTGAVLAAQTGATLAELMERLGHSTSAAALRYQHVAEGRGALIAEKMSQMVEGAPE